MKAFYFVLILTILAVMSITVYFKNKASIFFGIAESREIAINSENAVEVGEIYVGQGQAIEVGDPLIKLINPELSLKINNISHELDELKAQNDLNTGSLQYKLNQLKAEKAAREDEFQTQIRELGAQYELNKKLTSKLKSIDTLKKNGEDNNPINPIQLKIQNLKNEMDHSLRQIQMQIDELKSGMSKDENPLGIKINSLEQELALLKEDEIKLKITSPIKGVIGSVNYKQGEKVSPFTTLLTLHNKAPSYIKGYIHEKIYSKVQNGQSVKVFSTSGKSNYVKGEIVGVGSRIVEYPIRLRKRQDIQIWGREVVIKIPEENSFLLGEKVMIEPELNPFKSFSQSGDTSGVSVQASSP